jgi:tetratricopeptide (TPR) repeat protein
VVATLRRAFDYYAEVGDVPRAVAVAETPFLYVSGHARELTELISLALALVPADSHEAGRLLSRYGFVMGLEEGDYEAAQEAFDRVFAIAKREEDTALEMRTLVNASSVDYFHLRARGSLEKGLRAIELARHANDLQAAVVAHYWPSAFLRGMGDLEGARKLAAAMLALAEKLGDRLWLASALWLNENVCFLAGDWKVAREHSDRALAASPMDSRLLWTRALLEFEVGDFEEGEAYLERLVEVAHLRPLSPTLDYALTAYVIPLAGRITGVMDRFNVAEEAAEGYFSSPSAPVGVYVGGAGLALMAVQKDDAKAAGEHYGALQSGRGMIWAPGIHGDRLLGLVAQTMGRLDDAMTHFEESLAFCRKGGYRPEYAWSTCDYADCLLQRNASGDRTKAMSLLDEGLAISRELGMHPLTERILSRKDILKA